MGNASVGRLRIPPLLAALVLLAAPCAGAEEVDDPELKKKKEEARRQQLAAGVSYRCTNGWVPVYGKVKQVQTFKARGAQIGQVSFRAARTLEYPGDNLWIQIRDPKTGKVLALYKFLDYNWGKIAVSRYFRSYTFKIGPVNVKKGQTYEVVFSAPRAEKGFVWMINCFYRNTYKAGRQHREEGGREVKGGDLDLAIQVSDSRGNPVARTIPADVHLKAKEHYGLSYEEVHKILKAGKPLPDPGEKRPPAKGDPLPAPGPRMTLKAALAAAARSGPVVGKWTDPRDAKLTWIAVRRKFLLLYDARDGSLSDFRQFQKLIGSGELTVKGMAFAADRVWAASDRGAFVYERRVKAWAQLAINLDFDLVSAPIEKVTCDGKSVVFNIKGKGRYALNRETNKWRKLPK